MKKVVCPASGCQQRRRHWCDPDTPRGPQMVEVPDDWPDEAPAYCCMTCALVAGYITLEYVKDEDACPACLAKGFKIKHRQDYKCWEESHK
jgi:hypothetical protein